MEKSFHIEGPSSERGNYHESLLRIVNEAEKRVRAVIGIDKVMHDELHEKKVIDSRQEEVEFTDVRKDICESFGIPFDDEHIYIYEGKIGNQRAMRAFYVLIDAVREISLYGEGRIGHVILLNKLAERLSRITGLSEKEISADIDDDTSEKYLIFKGFLSIDGFKDMSDTNRRVLETPIVDEFGQKVETPENWFVTGHNVPPSTPLPQQ